MNRHLGFIILAICLFVIGVVFAFVDGAPKEADTVLLFGGLASFAAAHLP